jgi:hypothetical protein
VDWVTISALSTAGGTLVLAGATFASVRSANRAARAAERTLLAGLRPLLMPSRLEDPLVKINFADDKWLRARGGGGAAEATDQAVYLGMSLRNAGNGIAVLHGWRFYPERPENNDVHPDLDSFRRLSRDLYIPANDIGFWQGAFRDAETEEFQAARVAVEARRSLTIDVLYGDYEGGQRTISRFLMRALDDADNGWLVTVGRHWNIDRAAPR